MKKKENPSKPLQSPKVHEDKKENFALLLDYYGLTNFFYPPSVYIPLLDIDNIEVVQPHGSEVNVKKSENKIQFLKTLLSNDFYFLACKPPLISSGEGSFWKVTIDAFSQGHGGLCLGIIGKLDADNNSYADSTSCGWTGGSSIYGDRCYINGGSQTGFGGWSGDNFTEGECFYFHLKSKKLTMFSVQKNTKFTMDVATTVDTYYIHFNLYQSGKSIRITLEPLNEEERAKLR